jgi:Terpene cyclase DEP1
MLKSGVTALMAFYGTFAIAGAIVPWYFNIRYMRESGELLTPQMWLAGGFVNSLTGSITTDFLIGTIPVLVWMIVEARRLGMRHLWFYVVTTFLIAFAFSCPLFLLMREVRLRAMRVNNTGSTGG